MSTIRFSKQRDAILKNLQSRYDHPSADEVYADLKDEYPNLSLGTVYRNLALLVETGQIRKLDIGEPIVHYDGNMTAHQHFICTRCHKIHDINIRIEDIISDEVKSVANHKVVSYDLVMQGICEECQKKEN